jgi:hypothetical protein
MFIPRSSHWLATARDDQYSMQFDCPLNFAAMMTRFHHDAFFRLSTIS